MPLTHFTNVSITSFFWSNDGNKIMFLCPCALDGSDATNPTANIWVTNADGSGRKPLTLYTNFLVQVLEATWSVDGTKIFFRSNGDLGGMDSPIGGSVGAENIWVMNADGSGMRPLTVLVNSGVSGGVSGGGPQRSLIGSTPRFRNWAPRRLPQVIENTPAKSGISRPSPC